MGAFGPAANGFTEHALEEAAADIARSGYTALDGGRLRTLLPADVLETFSQFWNDLPADEALTGGGGYRYRRYGRVRVEVGAEEPSFEVLPHTTFRQDGIPLWRGAEREFAPIEEKALLHPGMAALTGFDTALATAISGRRSWELGIHQIRMVAGQDEDGLPTPEGRHRDGHWYIGMHLLSREDCQGGESTIYPEQGEPAKFTLRTPLDSVFVDDRQVTHEVSPTKPIQHTGIRDMLLVDINPGGEAR
ncbi:2OG-Fe dioxygenase family protein [Streptomyces apocyni]|uniref:2OG-Fe dioxygenase family protein n=1 Tax=Streptomyces apocyni TaxID=2654677 RepID=UPI0012EA7B69|nr:2OG-Fe dioxygenase family protein [Streptomyces apocyni]